MNYFDTSMTIRWLDLTMPELLVRVHYIRLVAIVAIDLTTQRLNRTRLPKINEQLAHVTQKPVQYRQTIQSLLVECEFHWTTLCRTSICLTNDRKSPIRVSNVYNNDDFLIATYDKDHSYAFIVFNMNYLSFHQRFFTGLRQTTSLIGQTLSRCIVEHHLPASNDREVSVYLCIRNMTTVFLRHRFRHCRLKPSSSTLIELIRTTDMNEELGPQLEHLPKFNWKTNAFNGTVTSLCLIDLVVLNEQQCVAFSSTVVARLLSIDEHDNENEAANINEHILSSNVWNIQARSQCNRRIRLDGKIMRLDNEYCALGQHSQSWHLQTMTCQF
jgi:hypothetical protein